MTTTSNTEHALRQEVRDLTDEWLAAGRYTPRSDAWLRSFDAEFSRELGRRHLLGISWPRAYGGRGLGNVARLAVTEELLRAGAPVAAHWMGDRQIGPAILRYGSDRLRDELLPGIVAGEHVFCLGMSEPEAGSDLAAVTTSARRTEGGWVITGRKTWTSHAHHATHAYVLARTSDGERKHQGLSEFIVDMHQPGITVDPIHDLAGQHHFNEVVFTEAFAPADRLLGTEGDGWRQVTEQLSFERGGPERVLSSYVVMRTLLDGQDGGDVPELGELIARLGALRQLCHDIARALDEGEAPIQAAASLKYLGNLFEREVVEAAFRSRGAGIVSAASAFGDGLLAQPAFDIRGGAQDVLLSIIAKQEARG